MVLDTRFESDPPAQWGIQPALRPRGGSAVPWWTPPHQRFL